LRSFSIEPCRHRENYEEINAPFHLSTRFIEDFLYVLFWFE